MIQRAFARVDKGTYIDVGASVPIPDSNTYALYEKGWRGIAIEPLDLYNDQWKQYRPEDTLINKIASSSSSAQRILNIYDGAQQVSTCVPQIVEHWEKNANLKPDVSVSLETVTLNELINDKPIHLISIDVEGMEAEVLSGLNLRTHRPWLIVIEATIPGTPYPNHRTWEPLLLDNGYLMVYFDGVNRFYLANEQRNLIGAFATPPNSWDQIKIKI